MAIAALHRRDGHAATPTSERRGNRAGVAVDQFGMDAIRPDVPSCDDIWPLLSADVDGETDAAERLVIDEHLASCAGCRTHVERLAALTRQFRLRPVEAVPDLTARVVDRSRPPRLGRGGWLRPALAWVAIVVVVQSLGPLVLGQADGATTHVARHLGAFAAALGVGLLYVAWRPHRAFGLLPFAAALVATMSVGAVLDVVSGTSTFASEALHVTELAGLALLWMIAGSPGWERLTAGWTRRSRVASLRG